MEDYMLDREDLMTPQELESIRHDPRSETIPTFPAPVREWLMGDNSYNTPEAATRRAFEKRPPAMGATEKLLNDVAHHYQRLPSVQQRRLLASIRSRMMRMLISCDGAVTLEDHISILRKEIQTGICGPVPSWYKYSTVTMGPRKIGYFECSHRDCHHTERVDTKFSQCARCKLPSYCSRDCQKVDWKARHKQLCNQQLVEEQEQIVRVGKMLQGLTDLSLTGQGFAGMRGLHEALDYAKTNPAVRERRRHLRAEKKRPKGV